jgi:hypothetical protein
MKDGRRSGRPPHPYTPPAAPQGQINITDPDSHVVKGSRGRGFMQGYAARAVANEHQIVIAAHVITVTPDFGHLKPMLDAANTSCMPPASATSRRCCSQTPATGINNRCSTSSSVASVSPAPHRLTRSLAPKAAAGQPRREASPRGGGHGSTGLSGCHWTCLVPPGKDT